MKAGILPLHPRLLLEASRRREASRTAEQSGEETETESSTTEPGDDIASNDTTESSWSGPALCNYIFLIPLSSPANTEHAQHHFGTQPLPSVPRGHTCLPTLFGGGLHPLLLLCTTRSFVCDVSHCIARIVVIGVYVHLQLSHCALSMTCFKRIVLEKLNQYSVVYIVSLNCAGIMEDLTQPKQRHVITYLPWFAQPSTRTIGYTECLPFYQRVWASRRVVFAWADIWQEIAPAQVIQRGTFTKRINDLW